MERQLQRFCPLSELGNPQRTRVSTFPQRRRLAAVKFRQTAKPTPIVHFSRFSLRTQKIHSCKNRCFRANKNTESASLRAFRSVPANQVPTELLSSERQNWCPLNSPIVAGKTRSKGCSGRNRERHPANCATVISVQFVRTARKDVETPATLLLQNPSMHFRKNGFHCC
jgi:hypothetical protein